MQYRSASSGPSVVRGDLCCEALEGEHVSRSESEPDSASLRKVGAASLPEMVKPATAGEEAEEATGGPLGVDGDSARGKVCRGAWETWSSGGETQPTAAGKT